jgi:hypothetical protein
VRRQFYHHLAIVLFVVADVDNDVMAIKEKNKMERKLNEFMRSQRARHDQKSIGELMIEQHEETFELFVRVAF